MHSNEISVSILKRRTLHCLFINTFLIFFNRISFHPKKISESITHKVKQQRPWDVHSFFWTWNFSLALLLLFLFLVFSKWSTCFLAYSISSGFERYAFSKAPKFNPFPGLCDFKKYPFLWGIRRKEPIFLQVLANSGKTHFTANAEMGKNTCLPSNRMHLVVHMH